MSKVLLLFPQINKYSFGDEWEEIESLMPPLGLLYLATPLIKKGHDVELIDLNVEKYGKEEFLNKTKDKEFILITCLTHSLSNAERLIKDIRGVNKNSIILCGGPHCNLFKEPFKGADYTVVGEAEHLIVDLLESIKLKKSLKKFPGLIYKHKGRLIKNPNFMSVKDLDSSGPPALEIVNMSNYGRMGGFKVKIAPIMSSRGCPFKCSYCTFKLTKYRERSAKSVFKEIKELAGKGYEYVFFCDDNFLLNKRRINQLLDMIIEQKVKMNFIFQSRVDTADLELYNKLRKAGTKIIFFGIENANQDVLDFYNKQVKVSQIKKAVEIANKAGILTIGFLIFGSPVETKEHFRRNREFFSKIPLDFVFASVLYYQKGTRIWESANKKGLIKDDELEVRVNNNLSNFSFEELNKERKQFVKHFYKNPKRLIRITYKAFRLGLLKTLIKALLNNRLNRISTDPYTKID